MVLVSIVVADDQVLKHQAIASCNIDAMLIFLDQLNKNGYREVNTSKIWNQFEENKRASYLRLSPFSATTHS